MISASPDGISKSQLDALGVRLRNERLNAEDARTLARYRGGFAAATHALRTAVLPLLDAGVEVTSRPMKSTSSIIAKLQDAVAGRILQHFSDAKKTDRRIKPSHGYRVLNS